MLEFLKAFRNGKYDRERATLSNWLFGIARRVILNLRGRQPLEQLVADKTTGTSFWDLIQDDRGIKYTWETEWRRMVLDSFENAIVDGEHTICYIKKDIIKMIKW